MPRHRKHHVHLVHPRLRTQSPPRLRSTQPPHRLRRNSLLPPLPHEVEPPLHTRPTPLPLPHARRPHALPLRNQPRQLPLRRPRHRRRNRRRRPRQERHHRRTRNARPTPHSPQTTSQTRTRPRSPRRRRLLERSRLDPRTGPGHSTQGILRRHGGNARQRRRALVREDQHRRRCVQSGPRSGCGEHDVHGRCQFRSRRRVGREAIEVGCRPRGVFEILRRHVEGISEIPSGRSQRRDLTGQLARGQFRFAISNGRFRIVPTTGLSTLPGRVDVHPAIRRFHHQAYLQRGERTGRHLLRSKHRRQEESKRAQVQEGGYQFLACRERP
mmetsp:Transcript_2708/g.5039  ORF Transcript_2708/g.5039 Transcript_2708/m.5039 type:complete len:327 (-) Transcript_2708:506-1486(-)